MGGLDLPSFIDPLGIHISECLFSFIMQCILPHSYVETLTLRAWYQKVGPKEGNQVQKRLCEWKLLDGIIVMLRRETRDFSVSVSLSLSALRQTKKIAICKPEKGPLQRPVNASSLILDFPGSRTVRNKFLLFKLLSVVFLLQQPELRHPLK